MYTAVFVLPPAGWEPGWILYRETGKALVLLLRDHESFTPVASAPLHSLGSTAHGRTDPASTLGLWLCRSIIIPLYLSSPPSGCNPDSDSSPLSLSPEGGHREVGVNLARYFNADTRNVPYGLVFSCQCPVKDNPILLRGSDYMSLHLYVMGEGKTERSDEKKLKKGLSCYRLVTTEAKNLRWKTLMGLF